MCTELAMSTVESFGQSFYRSEPLLADVKNPQYFCDFHAKIGTVRLTNIKKYELPVYDGMPSFAIDIFMTTCENIKTWYKGSRRGPFILWQDGEVRDTMVAQSCRECAYIAIRDLQVD